MNALIFSIVIAALFLAGALTSIFLAFKAAKKNAVDKINNRKDIFLTKSTITKRRSYTLAK